MPGLAKATERLLREQVLSLESKLKPSDDKRNPAYYRPKRRQTPPAAPAYHWNNDDWIAAQYGARVRSACVCEICQAAQADTYRIHAWAPGERLTRHNVEFVCAVCAEAVPREKFM